MGDFRGFENFAERLSYLNVAHNNITTLSGIDRLVNLVVLRCSSNRISDLSQLAKSNMGSLEEFWVSNNQLEDLDQIQHLKVSHRCWQTAFRFPAACFWHCACILSSYALSTILRSLCCAVRGGMSLLLL